MIRIPSFLKNLFDIFIVSKFRKWGIFGMLFVIGYN